MGGGVDGWLTVFDLALAEALLFAGCLFLVGGIDDLAIDLAWARIRRPPASTTCRPRRRAGWPCLCPRGTKAT